MIYKYRMLSELNEDFLREYELKATSTFRQFHDLILETVSLPGKELASFFICDGEWNRMTEITLLDMRDEESEEAQADEILIMQDTLLRDFMEEPRQRMVFEYDFLNPKTFYVEMNGISKDEEGAEYPRCLYSRGEAKPPKVEEEEEDLEQIEMNELEELLRGLGNGMTEEGPETD